MEKIKLSDYIVKFIEGIGVKHIFLIPGGGNIHIIDSIGNSKRIKYVCNYHEQACATGAESYARITGNIGVCVVTTGPGSTNAITGMLGGWLDSIPMLIISGQVKRELLGSGKGMRQLGDQEINIVDIVKPIAKYAVTIMDPNEIRYHLEKAVFLAKTGRPGPVWLDIPLDIQGSYIDPKELSSFDESKINAVGSDRKLLRKQVTLTLEKLRKSKRPVLYAGNGIRLSGGAKEFLTLVDMLNIPVLTSYAGYDLIPSSHPCFLGRGHAFGQRAANFILQNSDVFLSIGARLDIRTIGFTYKAFARGAYKVMVDIDKSELDKFILSLDLKVNVDAKEFIEEMIRQLKKRPLKIHITDWFTYGRNLNSAYPVVSKEYWKDKEFVNPYCFIETIGKYLAKNELIVLSDGVGSLNCMYQAFYVKSGQRIILNNGSAQMGYGLPAAIGVAFASDNKKRVICLEGDGSLQLNIHELQTMKYYNLPIKLFIFSNDGYLSIRNTQNNLFGGRHVAVDSRSGVSAPDFVKVAKAYGFKAIRINNHQDMEKKIREVLKEPGPIVCDIHAVRNLMLTPKLTTRGLPNGQFESPPLEDMGPFLPRDEFKKNMIIPLWKG
ncbi:MAG: thiamine pyrophosphate-binding protein [Candidatus Gottesmanbacteria bacterium]